MCELFSVGDRVSARLSLTDRWRSATVIGRSFDALVVSTRDARVSIPRRLVHRHVRPMRVVATVKPEVGREVH